MKQDSILDNIIKAIHGKDPNAEAFLFGSRARGDNQPDSDWDILILIDNLEVLPLVDQVKDFVSEIKLHI